MIRKNTLIVKTILVLLTIFSPYAMGQNSDVYFLDAEKNTNKDLSNYSVQYIKEDHGVSIMDFTGNYDKIINGSINSDARRAVLKEFYQNQDDNYDFVYIFTEFEFDTGIARAFAIPLMNDTQGIGKSLFDIRASFFTQKLQSIIDMAAMQRGVFNPSSKQYDDLLDIMMHETMHRWGVYVNYQDQSNTISENLLGESNAHWSYFFNSQASVMYGSQWQNTTASTYRTTDRMHALSPFDLYLAGFLDKSAITDSFLITNANTGNRIDYPPVIGTEITGQQEPVSINDIIAAEGERNPLSVDSQHSFKVKFILLKHPGLELKEQSIGNLFVLQKEFQKRFLAETNGIGQIQFISNQQQPQQQDPSTLTYNPNLIPQFDTIAALKFIINKTTSTWWADKDSSKVRDATAVIKAIKSVETQDAEILAKLSELITWINSYQAKNNDEKAWLLMSNDLNVLKRQALKQELLDAENSSGGWGLTNASNPSIYDTALVLKALYEVSNDDYQASFATTQFIINNLSQDNGSPYVTGGKSSLMASTLLLHSIEKLSLNPQLSEDLAQYILSQKRANNTYGDGTAHETAQTVLALESTENSNYLAEIGIIKNKLNTMQSDGSAIDGKSVQGSIYSTALLTYMFNKANKANLYISDININTTLVAGQQLPLSFQINNAKSIGADNVSIKVYRDTIAPNNLLSSETIAQIAINQPVQINQIIDSTSFGINTQLIIIVDEENTISESNETDNTQTIALNVQAPSNVPELSFDPSAFSYSPTQFTQLPFTTTVSATVSNLSLLDNNNVRVDLSIFYSDNTKQLLQQKVFDITALTTKTYDFNAEISTSSQDVQLIVEIDPENSIAEFNETNNDYIFTINKVESIDLVLNAQDITLPAQAIVGDVQNISFDFSNLGTENATAFDVNVYALYNTQSQLLHNSHIDTLHGGEQAHREITWYPQNAGDYDLKFVIDETNQVAETDENNNEVTQTVTVVSNTQTNLRIEDQDISLSPNPGLQGQDIHFLFTIHNPSAIDSGDFDIKVYQKNESGTPNTLLLTQTVSSIAAATDALVDTQLNATTIKGEQTFIFVVDSENTNAEYNENDNQVIKNFQILSKADAYVSSGSIQLTPATPALGQPLSIETIIANIGEQDIVNLTVSLYYDNSQASNPVLVETQQITALTGGQNQNQSFNFTFPNDATIDSIILKVDEANSIDEGDENNNNAQIIIANQDQDLYVSNRYFSPNGDNIKDDTNIIFNLDVADTYHMEIIDKNNEVIRIFDSSLFSNTTFGSQIWDGIKQNGVLARDGDYTIRLLSNSALITTTTVTLDTNQSPLFESLLNENGYVIDSNCAMNLQNSELRLSNDGKFLFVRDYLDSANQLQRGLYTSNLDGSNINRILPTGLTDSNYNFFILSNNNLLVTAHDGNSNRIYLKDIKSGTLTLLDDDSASVESYTSEFAITKSGNSNQQEFSKIYYNTTIPKQQTQQFNNQAQVLQRLRNGIIVSELVSFNLNPYDIHYLSYDFTQPTVLLKTNITYEELEKFSEITYVSNSRKYFAILSDSDLIVYESNIGSLIQIFSKEVGNNTSFVFNSFDELVLIEENNSLSIKNLSGNQVLNTNELFNTQEFEDSLGNYTLTDANSYYLSIDYYRDKINTQISSRIENFTDSTDKKELVFDLVTTLEGDFNKPPCTPTFDNNCGVFENIPDIVHIKWYSYKKKIFINYDNLLDIRVISTDFELYYEDDKISNIQEGRSDLINKGSSLFYKNFSQDNSNVYSGVLQTIKNVYPNTGVYSKDVSHPKSIDILKRIIIKGKPTFVGDTCSVSSNGFYIYQAEENLFTSISLFNRHGAVKISVVAFDKVFEKYELYWTKNVTPENWNTLFSSNQSQKEPTNVINWIPPEEGSYTIKVIAYDKAGNMKYDQKQIAVTNPISTFSNLLVEPLYFSPNDDGIKDFVNISYDVLSATDMVIEIKNIEGLVVRSYQYEYLNVTDDVLIKWDGRDEQGNRLSDGIYYVIVQGISSKVVLDTHEIIVTGNINIYDRGIESSFIINNAITRSKYQSKTFQKFDSIQNQWVDVGQIIQFDMNSLNIIFDTDYRIVIEDKAGNVSYNSVNKYPKKIRLAQIKKIVDDGKVINHNTSTLPVTQDHAPELMDRSTGLNFGFVFQPLTYTDIESITIDTDGEMPINVSPLDSSMVVTYFGSRYLGQNLQINTFDNVKSEARISMPVFMVEFDIEDILGNKEFLKLRFKINLSNGTSEDAEAIFKFSSESIPVLREITFKNGEFSDSMTSSEVEAYHKIKNTIGYNPNFHYFWFFQTDINSASEPNGLHLNIFNEEEAIISSSIMSNANMIETTGEYISRLYISPKQEQACRTHMEAYWSGYNFNNEYESNILVNDRNLCASVKLDAQFLLGELCNTTPVDNHSIRFFIDIDIDKLSTLPRLIEIYRQTPEGEILINADTNPYWINTGSSIQYKNQFDYDITNLPPTSYTFIAYITDSNGNTVSQKVYLDLDSHAAINSFVNPQASQEYCASKEWTNLLTRETNLTLKMEDTNVIINSNSNFQISNYLYLHEYYAAYIKPEITNDYLGYNSFSKLDSNRNGENNYNVSGFSGDATLIVETINSSGISYCSTKNITIDSLVDYTITNSLNKRYFSPNNDGVKEIAELFYIHANERLKVTVEIYSESGNFLGNILSRQFSQGEEDVIYWDGVINNNLQIDGQYLFNIKLEDDCGLIRTGLLHESSLPFAELRGEIILDTLSPVSTFITPKETQPLSAINAVLVEIDDENYNERSPSRLEFQSNSVWNGIEIDNILFNEITRKYEINAIWNLSNLPINTYPLRIIAEDLAGNVGITQINPAMTEVHTLFWNYKLSPRYISPNADAIKDEVKIDFGLNLDANVSITVLDSNQNAVATIINNQAYTQGSHQLVWNGQNSSNTIVTDGIYTIKITASETAQPANTDTLSLNVTVDNQVPVIQWLSPNSPIFKGQGQAQVQLDEINPQSFTVENKQLEPLSEPNSVLNESRSGVFELFDMATLTQNTYQLTASATDMAGNKATALIDYTIDNTPPVITIQTPEDGDIVGGLENSIHITGEIDELHLDHYEIALAEDTQNLMWQDIYTGSDLELNKFSNDWLINKSDGKYKLRVKALDLATWESEEIKAITIDTTAPTAVITSPVNGAIIGKQSLFVGSVTDENLDFYILYYRPVNTSSWLLLQTGQAVISNDVLGLLGESLADGSYEIKLVAKDLVGLTSETQITITLDAQAPPIPLNLTAELVNTNDINLQWDTVTANDFVGYNLYRNGEQINQQALVTTQYTDAALTDGDYVYTVTSIDTLGNISEPSNQVTIAIDTTPPDVALISPINNQRVNQVIDITGTAVSLLDFKDFKLYYRQTGDAQPGILINSATVPVTNVTLGQLDTTSLTQEQSYTLRLEARDNSDNSAFVEQTIFVDNTAPTAPLNLTLQLQGQNDVQLNWSANNESDLYGYLVYRNGIVISGNGSGIANLGNSITSLDYLDASVVDGTHSYYITAIDTTGNISQTSNSVEVTINLRAPDTLISQPVDNKKFEHPIQFEATSPDLDIAEIKLEYSIDNTNWIVLETPQTAPYQSIINPSTLGLSYGNLYLRAQAKDTTGQVDASPATITVEYTDLTAPLAITNLVAEIDGGQISLVWDANTETDLKGYLVYRIESDNSTTLLTNTALTNPQFIENNLADGSYSYQVTAVDNHDNESETVSITDLIVFSINLKQPFSPVLTPAVLNLFGTTPQTDGVIKLQLDNQNGQSNLTDASVQSNGQFNLDAISLVEHTNTINATHQKAANHKSKTASTQVQMSPLPAIPQNFQATLAAMTSTLSWDATANTFAYLPYKNGLAIYPIEQLTTGLTYSASSNSIDTGNVTIENASWSPTWDDQFGISETYFEIDLDQQRWLTSFELTWNQNNTTIYAPFDYEIQYSSAIGWITIDGVKHNNNAQLEVTTNTPYLTDKIRILIHKNPQYQNIELAEVKINHQPLTQQLSSDNVETDGIYSYYVTAINTYGFESAPSQTAELTIGDVIAPNVVTLTANLSGTNDAQLSWTNSSSSDVVAYWVFRNNTLASIINDVNTTTFLDLGLANGSYDYSVKAIDAVGNQSPHSNTQTVVVSLQDLLIPQNLTVTAAQMGGALTINWDTVVSTRLDHYNLYRSETSATNYQKIVEQTTTTYEDTPLINGTTYYYVVTTVDQYGNESAYSQEDFGTPRDLLAPNQPVITVPTVNGLPITINKKLTDISGNAQGAINVDLYVDNTFIRTEAVSTDYAEDSFNLLDFNTSVLISKTGVNYAFIDWNDEINIIDTTTTQTVKIQIIPDAMVWNDAGTLLYIINNNKLSLYDSSGAETQVLLNNRVMTSAVPSPDEKYIIYFGEYTDTQTNITKTGLWLYDTIGLLTTEIGDYSTANIKNKNISWSNDGQKIAIIRADNQGDLSIYTRQSQSLETIDTEFGFDNQVRWSTDDSLLIYDKTSTAKLYTYEFQTSQATMLTPSQASNGSLSTDNQQIVYVEDCCLVKIYDRATQTTQNLYPSDPNNAFDSIDDLRWNTNDNISLVTNEKLHKFKSPGFFEFKDTSLENGVHSIHVIGKDEYANQSIASLPITIEVVLLNYPDIEVKSEDIIISPQDALSGSSFNASVTISNKGDTAATDITIDVLLSYPDATTHPLTINPASIDLAANQSQSILIDLGQLTMAGQYQLQVISDAANTIDEINENNNNAFSSLLVLENLDPILYMYVAPQQVIPSANVDIDLRVYNPDQVFSGTLLLSISDENAYTVESQLFDITNLQTQSNQENSYSWQTQGIYSGTYTISSQLKDSNGQLIEEKSTVVELNAFAQFELALNLQDNSISQNENLEITANIHYTQGNALQDAVINWSILDENQQQIYTDSSTQNNMLAGFNTTINKQWLANNVGNYILEMEFISQNYQQTLSQPFEVQSAQTTLQLQGDITAAPDNIILGDNFTIDYTLSNTGTTTLVNVPITLKLLSTDLSQTFATETTTQSLSVNASQNVQSTFNSIALTQENYLIALYADLSAYGKSANQILNTQTVSAIDTTAPQITISQPLDSSLNAANPILKYSITDLYGEVAEITLESADINQGQEQSVNTNQFANNYQYPLANLSDGNHQIIINAIDNHGNSSQMTVTFQVDALPPVIDITGVADLLLYNHSVTANVSINDANLQDTSIQLNAATISTNYDITQEGNYYLAVNATDSVGNSSYASINFSLDLTAPEIIISYPENNAELIQNTTLVTAQTEAHAQVSLNTASFSANEQADANGRVDFYDVPLQLGANTITLQATDLANNTGAQTPLNLTVVEPQNIQATINLAKTHPIEQDLSVAFELKNLNATAANNLEVQIQMFDASNNLLDTQTATYNLTGNQIINDTKVFITSNSTPENHTFILSVMKNGQWQQQNIDNILFIDTTAPEITTNLPQAAGLYAADIISSIDVTDRYSPLVTISYQLDNSGKYLVMLNNTEPNFIANLHLSHGQHSILFKAIDSANNEIITSSLAFEVDAIAPVIVIKSPTNELITNQDVTLDYYIQDDHLDQSSASLNSQTVSSGDTISTDGIYTLMISAKDTLNNQSSEMRQFEIDKTPPDISVTNLVNNQQFQYNDISALGLSEANISITMHNVTTNETKLATTNAQGQFSIDLIHLQLGENQLQFSASDQAGNQSQTISLTIIYGSTDPCSVFGLKSAANYNAFVLGDYLAQNSSIGGRLASGGSIYLDNYSIGEHLPANEISDVLIAQYGIDFAQGQVHHGNILAGGTIQLGQSVIDSMYANTQIVENVQNLPLDFNQSYKQLKLFSNALSEKQPNASYDIIENQLYLNGNCNQALQIYTLTSVQLANISTINSNCSQGSSYVILNISGENISVQNIDMRQMIRPQYTLWNFYQAKSIDMRNSQIIGSVLAIDAHISQTNQRRKTNATKSSKDRIYKNGFEDWIFRNGFDSDLIQSSIDGQLIAHSFDSNIRMNNTALSCSNQLIINAKPIAIDGSYTTDINTAVPITLEVIDENPTTLSYVLLSQVTSGSLTGTMPNLVYTPNNNFEGTDSFIYKVIDENGQVNNAIIHINVQADVIFKDAFELINKALTYINHNKSTVILLMGILVQTNLWRRK